METTKIPIIWDFCLVLNSIAYYHKYRSIATPWMDASPSQVTPQHFCQVALKIFVGTHLYN